MGADWYRQLQEAGVAKAGEMDVALRKAMYKSTVALAKTVKEEIQAAESRSEKQQQLQSQTKEMENWLQEMTELWKREWTRIMKGYQPVCDEACLTTEPMVTKADCERGRAMASTALERLKDKKCRSLMWKRYQEKIHTVASGAGSKQQYWGATKVIQGMLQALANTARGNRRPWRRKAEEDLGSDSSSESNVAQVVGDTGESTGGWHSIRARMNTGQRPAKPRDTKMKQTIKAYKDKTEDREAARRMFATITPPEPKKSQKSKTKRHAARRRRAQIMSSDEEEALRDRPMIRLSSARYISDEEDSPTDDETGDDDDRARRKGRQKQLNAGELSQ